MSSEMRKKHAETLKAVRSVFDGIPAPCAERDALDFSITLLARTEAGADHGAADHGMDRATKESLVPCDCGCGRSCCAFCGTDIGFVTHPQDASGDAELREFAQLVLHGIESGNIKSPLVTRKVDGDYKLESLYDIGVAAMQAKEAK